MGEVCSSMNRIGDSEPRRLNTEPEPQVSQNFLEGLKTFFEDMRTKTLYNTNKIIPEKFYKYQCPIRNKLMGSSHDLNFIISNIKIKSCISHSKSKKSAYVTEISFTQKKFPIIVNYGAKPIINGTFDFHKQFSIEELENSFLKISVYEFDEMSESQLNTFKSENKLNGNLPQNKYFSYFEINLLSFLFRPNKCDFAMLGQTPLSSCVRIVFNCDIEHKAPIVIKANSLSNQHNVNQLTLKNNYSCKSVVKDGTGSFSYTTGLLSINELKLSDLMLESDDSLVYYSYISLNSLKEKIINHLGDETIKDFLEFIKGKQTKEIQTNLKVSRHNSVSDFKQNGSQLNDNEDKFSTICPENKNNNTNFFDSFIGRMKFSQYDSTITEKDSLALLSITNLPLITQMKNLVFSEIGYRYNTAIFYIINKDLAIIEYMKSFGISFNDVYSKIFSIFQILSGNPSSNDIIRNCASLLQLLVKSADNDSLYFIYQSYEELGKMIIALLEICSSLILFLGKTSDGNLILKILQTINLIIKRQELNNDCICYCIRRLNSKGCSPKASYNNFYMNLFKLNSLLKGKLGSIDDSYLIGLYTILYFKKKFLRQAILSSFSNTVVQCDSNVTNIFIYELKYDEELNGYLSEATKAYINNILKSPGYFSNLTSGNHNKLLKYILAYQNNININTYPYDFIHFKDNIILLEYMKKHIKSTQLENISDDFHDSIGCLTKSILAFNQINSVMITSTNAYDLNNIYQLFEYLVRIITNYNKENKQYLLMDYSLLEKAIYILIQIDNMISLPKIFWFYYYVSHLVIRGNMKWFIKNVCNNSFEQFAYHWSDRVRLIFFKMLLFVMCNRIKMGDGKYFKEDLINGFIRNQPLQKKILYQDDAKTDFQEAFKDYQEWKQTANIKNGVVEYPELILPYVKNEYIDGIQL